MAFHNVRLPEDIEKGAVSSSKRLTDIASFRSGAESRNAIWYRSLHMYRIGYSFRDKGEISALVDFWEGRRGPLFGFRFKDWLDYKSCGINEDISSTDQRLLHIENNRKYQLQKLYSSSLSPYSRKITKPVVASVVFPSGVGSYVLDQDTGIVTFNTPQSSSLTVGFEFDVPVRFEEDTLQVDINQFNVQSAQGIALIEILQ